MGLKEHLRNYEPEREAKRIEDFISEKRSNIGFNKAVVGLSGGVDSSLTAVLTKRALPEESLEPLFFPERTTPEADTKDVNRLEEEFDLPLRQVRIDDLVAAFKRELPGLTELAEANLKARIRMTLLYAVANQKEGLVLGTGNLSEWLLGYFTKYGDGAADMAPLGHLYKTELKPLARHLEIPGSIIEKPPSAGLWEGQTDEEELGGSYERLDRVLYFLHDLDFSREKTKIEACLDSDFIDHVYDIVEGTSHKRKAPPGLTRT